MASPKVFEKTCADKNVLSNLKNMVTSGDIAALQRQHSASSQGALSQGKLRKGLGSPQNTAS